MGYSCSAQHVHTLIILEHINDFLSELGNFSNRSLLVHLFNENFSFLLEFSFLFICLGHDMLSLHFSKVVGVVGDWIGMFIRRWLCRRLHLLTSLRHQTLHLVSCGLA